MKTTYIFLPTDASPKLIATAIRAAGEMRTLPATNPVPILRAARKGADQAYALLKAKAKMNPAKFGADAREAKAYAEQALAKLLEAVNENARNLITFDAGAVRYRCAPYADAVSNLADHIESGKGPAAFRLPSKPVSWSGRDAMKRAIEDGDEELIQLLKQRGF